MKPLAHIARCAVACGALFTLHALQGFALPVAQTPAARGHAPSTAHDGPHDFDFEIGMWKTHLQRLLHPLTGSTTWVEYDGTTRVSKVWDGRANLVELEVDGTHGHIEGMSLRLYNPEARQWSLNFSNSAGGSTGQPTVGEFKDGRGEFVDQETLNGRAILVRFVISEITPDSCHFEQAFSVDGGKTWEVNWIATDTRVKAETASAAENVDAPNEVPVPAGRYRQELSEAWWTGPLLAASGATLPRGHMLIEPYFYDVRGSHANSFGSSSYMLYGLANRLTVGSIPAVGYNRMSNALSSSKVGSGDFTLVAQHQLTQFHPGHWVPTAGAVLEETLPTGKYDKLGDRPSNGIGAGAYTTLLGIYPQTYFWLPNGRILRMRFDVSQSFSRRTHVEGVSVYGTENGFSGRAHPGASFLADPAWEYSVTRKWVLALDATYRHNWNTRVTGTMAGSGQSAARVVNSGSSEVFAFAPAVEYNWRSYLGVIVGTRVIPASHNTNESFTPVMAINFVR